jgi:hypothetical protein
MSNKTEHSQNRDIDSVVLNISNVICFADKPCIHKELAVSVETQDTREEYCEPLIFYFISLFLSSETFSKQEKEDTEIQFGTSYLRLVGLPGGLEILSRAFPPPPSPHAVFV